MGFGEASTYPDSPHRSHDLHSAARPRHIQAADVLWSEGVKTPQVRNINPKKAT